jgi:hypothetical protein
MVWYNQWIKPNLLVIDIILSNALKFLFCNLKIAWEARVAAMEIQLSHEQKCIALYKFPIAFS